MSLNVAARKGQAAPGKVKGRVDANRLSNEESSMIKRHIEGIERTLGLDGSGAVAEDTKAHAVGALGALTLGVVVKLVLRLLSQFSKRVAAKKRGFIEHKRRTVGSAPVSQVAQVYAGRRPLVDSADANRIPEALEGRRPAAKPSGRPLADRDRDGVPRFLERTPVGTFFGRRQRGEIGEDMAAGDIDAVIASVDPVIGAWSSRMRSMTRGAIGALDDRTVDHMVDAARGDMGDDPAAVDSFDLALDSLPSEEVESKLNSALDNIINDSNIVDVFWDPNAGEDGIGALAVKVDGAKIEDVIAKAAGVGEAEPQGYGESALDWLTSAVPGMNLTKRLASAVKERVTNASPLASRVLDAIDGADAIVEELRQQERRAIDYHSASMGSKLLAPTSVIPYNAARLAFVTNAIRKLMAAQADYIVVKQSVLGRYIESLYLNPTVGTLVIPKGTVLTFTATGAGGGSNNPVNVVLMETINVAAPGVGTTTKFEAVIGLNTADFRTVSDLEAIINLGTVGATWTRLLSFTGTAAGVAGLLPITPEYNIAIEDYSQYANPGRFSTGNIPFDVVASAAGLTQPAQPPAGVGVQPTWLTNPNPLILPVSVPGGAMSSNMYLVFKITFGWLTNTAGAFSIITNPQELGVHWVTTAAASGIWTAQGFNATRTPIVTTWDAPGLNAMGHMTQELKIARDQMRSDGSIGVALPNTPQRV